MNKKLILLIFISYNQLFVMAKVPSLASAKALNFQIRKYASEYIPKQNFISSGNVGLLKPTMLFYKNNNWWDKAEPKSSWQNINWNNYKFPTTLEELEQDPIFQAKIYDVAQKGQLEKLANVYIMLELEAVKAARLFKDLEDDAREFFGFKNIEEPVKLNKLESILEHFLKHRIPDPKERKRAMEDIKQRIRHRGIILGVKGFSKGYVAFKDIDRIISKMVENILFKFKPSESASDEEKKYFEDLKDQYKYFFWAALMAATTGSVSGLAIQNVKGLNASLKSFGDLVLKYVNLISDNNATLTSNNVS